MNSQRYQSLEAGDEVEKVEAATHHNYGLKLSLIQALLLGLSFVILLCIAAFVSLKLANANSGCLGAPYLYISHHDGQNVLKYTRDGCPLSPTVLWFGRTVDTIPTAIRGLMIHPYKAVKNALFVSNAGTAEKDYGRIYVFDTCSGLIGMRPYIKTLVDERFVTGAQHAYSIAFDRDGDMYASFQTTDAVLRFSNTSYRPIEAPLLLPWFDDLYGKDGKDDAYSPLPPRITRRNYTASDEYYPGTFVQVH